MSLNKQQREEIRQFILWHVRDHPSDIVRVSQIRFNLSRTAILRYIHNLIREGQLRTEGSTRNKKYFLRPLREFTRTYQLHEYLAEDTIWRNDVLPLLYGIKENVLNICQYGFTEIFNNAIDHSEGKVVFIEITVWIDLIRMDIVDDGVGIFNKIQKKYNLDDPLHAILELSKGKLTTEPESHSGEGIFFTSRMFDFFAIISGNLRFGYQDLDILVEEENEFKGTRVHMEISPISDRTITDIFSKFTSNEDELGFDKTIVPVKLVRYGNENLISRSQAKRLLTRLDRFKTVLLDFSQIDMIGRAFADEIFRVYVNTHPATKIYPYNENKNIKLLIEEIQQKNEQ
jgi:anti-sigma regulatory factor (Ser/Thr protein kinase)